MIKKIFYLAFFSIIFLLPKVIFAHSGNTPTTIVQMGEDGFSPSSVEIKEGDTVVFKNTGRQPHWPASNIHPTHLIYPEFDPKRPINPGEDWSFTFEKAGVWKMHDHLNPESTGTVVVKGQKISSKGLSFESLLNKLKTFLINFFTKQNFPKKQSHKTIPVEKDAQNLFTSDDALFSYVKKFGPAQATTRIFELSSQYGDCHQTAHKLGRFAYEIYGDKAFQTCGAECHSGCYHGATEGYFRDHGTEDLADELRTICSSELNPFFSHQCIHGIGHGLMAWSNYDLPLALKSCDLLDRRRDSCYTGVFMENIIGGLSSESTQAERVSRQGHFTKYLNSDPQYPCTIVDEKYKGSCYFYQTSRMVQLFDGDFSKVANICLQSPLQYQDQCFQSMGRDVSGISGGDFQREIKNCSYAPAGSLRVDCIIGAAQDLFWDPTGKEAALSFCKMLQDSEEKRSCYLTIIDRAKDLINSPAGKNQFCQEVEPDFRNSCLNAMSL